MASWPTPSAPRASPSTSSTSEPTSAITPSSCPATRIASSPSNPSPSCATRWNGSSLTPASPTSPSFPLRSATKTKTPPSLRQPAQIRGQARSAAPFPTMPPQRRSPCKVVRGDDFFAAKQSSADLTAQTGCRGLRSAGARRSAADHLARSAANLYGATTRSQHRLRITKRRQRARSALSQTILSLKWVTARPVHPQAVPVGQHRGSACSSRRTRGNHSRHATSARNESLQPGPAAAGSAGPSAGKNPPAQTPATSSTASFHPASVSTSAHACRATPPPAPACPCCRAPSWSSPSRWTPRSS